MMKFILQDYEIRPDFQMELLRAKEYWDWRNTGKSEEQKTTIEILSEGDHDIEDGCPVGSVEFCLGWFKKYYQKTPRPINVPGSLSQVSITGRLIIDYTLPADLGLFLQADFKKHREVYLKSADLIKSGINGKYSLDDSIFELIDGKVQVSSILEDIHSEWRVFVYQGKILDIRCYSGDPFDIPGRSRVEEIIKTYKNPPIAYTLDLYTPEKFTTSYLMEVHDFFSCGLYGFSCYEKYPFMLWRWFKNFIGDE